MVSSPDETPEFGYLTNSVHQQHQLHIASMTLWCRTLQSIFATCNNHVWWGAWAILAWQMGIDDGEAVQCHNNNYWK
jgi:hypothetical protein